MIRITSKKAGFRRCGIPHPKGPVDYPDDRFSKEELATQKAESMLIIELVESPVERMIPDEPEPEPEPESKNTIDDVTIAQIKAELDIRGVEYDDKAKKAELFELYEGTEGEPE